MKLLTASSSVFCAVLAVLFSLEPGLRADAPSDAASIAVSGTAGAAVPLSGTAARVSATAAPSGVFASYPALLAGTISALGAPLAGMLQRSGQPGISVAAGGFRELVTGERSPFCDHLDRDLSNRLRDDTPYGVPSTLELADAWVSVGGGVADLSQPYTLARFGRLLDVQAVVCGDYLAKGDRIILRVRLMRCSDGKTLWETVEHLPVSVLPRLDLDTYSGSAPPGYGASLPAPPPPRVAAPGGPGASASAGPSSSRSADDAYLAGVRLESNVQETEFSIYRLNFGAGYEFDDPTDPTFRAVVRHISAPYVDLNWADIARVEFFFWNLNDGAASPEVPVSSLLSYGMTVSLTCPVRLGHYWVVYGGAGGRFEAINVNSPAIPDDDTVSFGNNSAFVTLGVKAHIRSIGVDTSASYGPQNFSDQTAYFTARLGLYYEYSFE